MPKEVQPSLLGLRSIKLLEGLPDERLEALARECAWRRYAADQRIISRDAPDRDVYLLVAGRVRVTTYSSAGKQVTFSDEGAGEIFGDMAAIDGERRSADVIALDDALIASMSPAAFRRLLAQEAIVAERVMRHLSGLVRRLSERVIDLSTLGVQNRIHAEILRLAREAGISRNTARIDPAPKHADIASQVSTYREQVTRELSALARAGVLGKNAGALVVRDVGKLEKMVAEVRNGA
jgi:CRP/FNR family cyclic AMP-dependent transcriptional regulator